MPYPFKGSTELSQALFEYYLSGGNSSSDTHARCLGIPYPFTSTVGFYDGFFSVFVLANAAFSLVAYNTVRDQSERLFYTPFRSFFIARLDINNRIEFKENKHI